MVLDNASYSISNAVVLAKSLVYFRALVVLQLLVSLISCVVACSARIETDRQTHRPSTVTLAAHARRGLKIMKGDVGIHEKERNKKMPTPIHKVTHNPIPTSLFLQDHNMQAIGCQDVVLCLVHL